MALELRRAIERIVETRDRIPADRAALIAVSGIDASGKGYLTARFAESLRAAGSHVANINIDGWLNLPQVRFCPANPAPHFYLDAIRFDDMFRQLIFPLRDRRSLRMAMDYTAETASTYRKEICEFSDIDVILLEGIYLLKRSFQPYYDLSIWIECSFETALERAVARGQEGLPGEATIEAYRTIYFPAQEIHFAKDDPRTAATLIVHNDPRLAARLEPHDFELHR